MKALGTKQLKTKRLVLREFRKEDIQSVYENYGSDPKVNRFISFAPCANLDSTKDFIAMHLQQYEINPSFYGWAITLNDEVIGSIGLFNVEEESEQCELGYSLGSRWWGNGYTTEAATEVLSYAFEQLKCHRIYASHHIDNLASGKVLVKIGMKEEGLLRDAQKNMDGTFSDLRLYAKLSTDE